jgi:signal transduction histidine kinase
MGESGKPQTIGIWMTSAIVVGTIIGSGIFMLPVALAPLGANALIAWLISGIGVICIAYGLGRLSMLGGGGIQENDYTLRTALLIGGVVLACALMIAASYGLYRITTRELQLARQQSDFVAAVSHEFRTPLTSMRHLLDLLLSRGISDEARKQSYYGLLAGETERLQRMVETLLTGSAADRTSGNVTDMQPCSTRGTLESRLHRNAFETL